MIMQIVRIWCALCYNNIRTRPSPKNSGPNYPREFLKIVCGAILMIIKHESLSAVYQAGSPVTMVTASGWHSWSIDKITMLLTAIVVVLVVVPANADFSGFGDTFQLFELRICTVVKCYQSPKSQPQLHLPYLTHCLKHLWASQVRSMSQFPLLGGLSYQYLVASHVYSKVRCRGFTLTAWKL